MSETITLSFISFPRNFKSISAMVRTLVFDIFSVGLLRKRLDGPLYTITRGNLALMDVNVL